MAKKKTKRPTMESFKNLTKAPVMTKEERKKKIAYGIAAVICIFLALYMEKLEKAENLTEYYFRNEDLLTEHYDKHGMEMGFTSKEAYEEAASAVVNNPEAITKTEAEDGDAVYYIEASNEFVVVSTDGYIRTYFNPDDGVEYFNRQ